MPVLQLHAEDDRSVRLCEIWRDTWTDAFNILVVSQFMPFMKRLSRVGIIRHLLVGDGVKGHCLI